MVKVFDCRIRIPEKNSRSGHCLLPEWIISLFLNSLRAHHEARLPKQYNDLTLSCLDMHCLFTLGSLYFVRFTDMPQETIYAHLAAFTAKFRSVASILATMRLQGRPGWEGCHRALWDCFGGRILPPCWQCVPKTFPQRTLRTISTRSPAQPKSDEYAR